MDARTHEVHGVAFLPAVRAQRVAYLGEERRSVARAHLHARRDGAHAPRAAFRGHDDPRLALAAYRKVHLAGEVDRGEDREHRTDEDDDPGQCHPSAPACRHWPSSSPSRAARGSTDVARGHVFDRADRERRHCVGARAHSHRRCRGPRLVRAQAPRHLFRRHRRGVLRFPRRPRAGHAHGPRCPRCCGGDPRSAGPASHARAGRLVLRHPTAVRDARRAGRRVA